MVDVTERESLPVSQAKAGVAEAWTILFQRYRLPLYIYIFQLVRNEQSSLDILQETMISAIRHIGTLVDDEKFGSWLMGIAHQKCIQSWHKQNREMDALNEMAEGLVEFEDDPREALIRQEQEADFMKLLDKLPLLHRSVLLLYFVEDFSLDEIAEITEVSLGTVKSRLHYAKKAFRELVKDKMV
jgi:RNA polymerase sigma-70 factor (ECF subfamily)